MKNLKTKTLVNEKLLRRKKMLNEPHILALSKYTKSLRNKKLGKIPDFDPLDGGTDAKILFLFEKPGPQVFGDRSYGFISSDNNDETAANTLKFMSEANIPRNITCSWNTIPGWDGKIKFTTDDERRGGNEIGNILKLLPSLKVIVLVGRIAQKNFARYKKDNFIDPNLKIIESFHPSPTNRSRSPDLFNSIPKAWAEAKQYI